MLECQLSLITLNHLGMGVHRVVKKLLDDGRFVTSPGAGTPDDDPYCETD